MITDVGAQLESADVIQVMFFEVLFQRPQEFGGEALGVVGIIRKRDRSFAGQLGPIAASNIGNRQWRPAILSPVIKTRWKGWNDCANCVSVVIDKADDLTAQLLKYARRRFPEFDDGVPAIRN